VQWPFGSNFRRLVLLLLLGRRLLWLSSRQSGRPLRLLLFLDLLLWLRRLWLLEQPRWRWMIVALVGAIFLVGRRRL
jgi:hypothetical protein